MLTLGKARKLGLIVSWLWFNIAADIRKQRNLPRSSLCPRAIKGSVLPSRWERAGSLSGKRRFAIAGIWRKLRTIFCRRLNQVLEAAGFDEFCRARCRKFYPEKWGRPSLAPTFG